MSMQSIVQHIFTGQDNRTIDVGRVLWVTMAVGFIVFAAWHVFHTGQFDPIGYGAGAGGLLTGGGAGVGLKAKAEPPPA